MKPALAILFAVPGMVRVGPLRLPVFGAFAAAGLMAALWLSQRTARRVGLDGDRVWDAGFAAALCAFVASRLLLIATDFHAFLRFPVLLLTLPSLTGAGVVLTAVFTAVWLRARRLPVREVLDAWTVPACVLLGVLAWAHLHEGSAAGMPAVGGWVGAMARVFGSFDLSGEALVPVNQLTMGAAAVGGALLWWWLPRRPPSSTG